MLTLTLRESLTVPLEAECLTPDVLAPLDIAAIRSLPVLLGKRSRTVADFFAVEGDAGDEIELRGDLSKVKWVARGMTRGRIRITGHAGMHLGSYMTGGEIEVSGNASDWVGGEMSGGTIRIGGNAGGQLGCAYRGSTSGMSGGTILVEGSAGIELGMRMKRGLIVVRGAVRDFAGLQMKGGTIVLMGGAE
jgi:formylmethanofuran dehydrogenase subunit C